MTTTPTIAIVPEINLPALEERIAKLGRRAAKLGQAPLTIRELSRETKRVARATASGRRYEIDYTWVTVEIVGDKPHLPGWRMLGTVVHQHQEAGAPNVFLGSEIPETYRTRAPICDHCCTSRRRKDTWILESLDTGETMQIGRNCLQDFLGTDCSAAAIVAWYEFEQELRSFGAVDEDGNPLYAPGMRLDTLPLAAYLTAVAATVRVDGWISRGVARENNRTSTADIAARVLTPSAGDLRDPSFPRCTDDDRAVAADALAWIRQLPENDRRFGYLANLYAGCFADFVRCDTMGLVASLVGAAYPRAMADAAKAAAQKQQHNGGGHVGEIKSKLTAVPVQIERVRCWESTYGPKTAITMRDESKRLIVWFASGDLTNIEPGAALLSGTVHKHDTDRYSGEPSTIVQRCKITPA